MSYDTIENNVITNLVEADDELASSQSWLKNQGWGYYLGPGARGELRIWEII